MPRHGFQGALGAVMDGERVVVRVHGSGHTEFYKNDSGQLIAEERSTGEYVWDMAARFRLRNMLSSPFADWCLLEDDDSHIVVAADGSGQGGSP